MTMMMKIMMIIMMNPAKYNQIILILSFQLCYSLNNKKPLEYMRVLYIADIPTCIFDKLLEDRLKFGNIIV
jgi:hypothetical protein